MVNALQIGGMGLGAGHEKRLVSVLTTECRGNAATRREGARASEQAGMQQGIEDERFGIGDGECCGE